MTAHPHAHPHPQADPVADAEARARLWKAIAADRTAMLSLPHKADPRPMTALLDSKGKDIAEYDGPIWFFTSTGSELVAANPVETPAMMTFAAKGHGVFATLRGKLGREDDRAVIDRLWNPFIAAWFPEGKDDPTLALLRLDPEEAEIWFDANSLLAGLKVLLGINPQREYRDKTARIAL